MFKNLKNKARNLKNKANLILSTRKALTQSTETILLIVLVVAILSAFFAPQITSWFGNVMTDLATYTDDIFAFGTVTPGV